MGTVVGAGPPTQHTLGNPGALARGSCPPALPCPAACPPCPRRAQGVCASPRRGLRVPRRVCTPRRTEEPTRRATESAGGAGRQELEAWGRASRHFW